MEFSPSSPPKARSHGFWWAAVAAAVLGIYAVGLIRNVCACAGGSDSSGYLNHARLLARGHVVAPMRTIPGVPAEGAPPYLYIPLGFKPGPDGKGMVPTYPAGLPLFIAALAPVTGWAHACDAVIVLHSLLGIVLMYGLGRAVGLPRPWAGLGAAILAASPLYLEYSLQAMSDMPSCVWTTMAVLAAWRSGEADRPRASRARWAAGAGIAFGIAVLFRPSNALALAPAALAMAVGPSSWRHSAWNAVWFGLAGLPAAVFFCLHSRAAYGSLLSTGYGNASDLFGTAILRETLLHYATWLPRLFTPVVWLAFGLPFLIRSKPKAVAVLGAWALAFLGFYGTYYYTHETWWYLRFVLPAAPALITASLLVARTGLAGRCRSDGVQGNRERAATAACVLAAAFATWNGAHWARKLDAWDTGRGEAVYPSAAAWGRAHLPPHSVLAIMQTSGAFFYYTDFTFVRWDQMDVATFRRVVQAAKAAGRPIYAVLFNSEKKEEVLDQRMPGRWSRIESPSEITVWRYEQG